MRSFYFGKSLLWIAAAAAYDPTLASTPCLPRELILDGSFEESGSPDWIQSSDNFATPICDYDTCGDGAGTATPFAGARWGWFGGFPGPETGRLEQRLTIPESRHADLRLWLWRGASSGNGLDFFRVSIDADLLFELTDPGQDAVDSPFDDDYAPLLLDVGGWADGEPHSLVLESTVCGPWITNVSVDEVSLTVCEEVGIVAIPALGPSGLLALALATAAAALRLLHRARDGPAAARREAPI